MGKELVKYDGITEEPSSPDAQAMNTCLDLLRSCNLAVNAARGGVQAALARMDAVDKMAKLYRVTRQSSL
jgi:hypothetical protein